MDFGNVEITFSIPWHSERWRFSAGGWQRGVCREVVAVVKAVVRNLWLCCMQFDVWGKIWSFFFQTHPTETFFPINQNFHRIFAHQLPSPASRVQTAPNLLLLHSRDCVEVSPRHVHVAIHKICWSARSVNCNLYDLEWQSSLSPSLGHRNDRIKCIRPAHAQEPGFGLPQERRGLAYLSDTTMKPRLAVKQEKSK